LCVVLAIRDLFASMDRAGASFPPIMMLNVLHVCFPQFAQKNDQGVFQQQVSFVLSLTTISYIDKYTCRLQSPLYYVCH